MSHLKHRSISTPLLKCALHVSVLPMTQVKQAPFYDLAIALSHPSTVSIDAFPRIMSFGFNI